MSEANFERKPVGLETRLGVVRSELSRERLFREGTLGFELFPKELEGRERVVVWDRPLEWYHYYNFNPERVEKSWLGGHEIKMLFPLTLRQKAAKIGVRTLSELLNKREEEFLAKGVQRRSLTRIKAKLNLFFDQLLLGPEGLLLWGMLKENPAVIPQEFDEMRRKTVDEVMSGLSMHKRMKSNPRRKRVLRLRFGFDNGNPRKIGEMVNLIPKVGGEGFITSKRVGQIISNAIALMRPSSRIRRLRDFHSPLPEGSFGRVVYGLGWPFQVDDLPSSITDRQINELSLSARTMDEMYKFKRQRRLEFHKSMSLGHFLRESIPAEISPEAQKEIMEALRQDFPLVDEKGFEIRE